MFSITSFCSAVTSRDAVLNGKFLIMHIYFYLFIFFLNNVVFPFTSICILFFTFNVIRVIFVILIYFDMYYVVYFNIVV